MNNNNDYEEDVQMVPSTVEVDMAANAVLGNPDTNKFGGPPDGVTGVATLTHATLVSDFKVSDWSGAASIWLVQWPTECPIGSDPRASWVIGGSESSVDSIPGLFNVANAAEPDWITQDYANNLEVGGLCVYVMGREPDMGALHSPFPTKQLDVKGPMNPITTIRLQPGTDVAHDLFRLLGGSYEMIDTTADLYKQGRTVSCCIDNPKVRPTQINVQNTPSVGQQFYGSAMVEIFTLPFGSTKDMTRVSNSVTMATGLGIFAPTRMTLLDNEPDAGFNVQHLYVGPVGATCQTVATTQQHVCLLLGSSWNVTQTLPGPTGVQAIASTPYAGKVWATNAGMSQTVIGGFNTAEFACQFQRKIVSQCFVNAASDSYFALADVVRVPADPSIMASLQNAQRTNVDFFPSEWNRTGRAFKKFRKALDTGLKAAKPLANIGKGVIKGMVNTAISANPALAMTRAAIQNNPALKNAAQNIGQGLRNKAKKAAAKKLSQVRK